MRRRTPARRAGRVLVISTRAGVMNAELEGRLRAEFADHLIVDFDPRRKLLPLLAPGARVVVAGGDGTVEFVIRELADSEHPLGIVPLGTFNNLARALALPTDVDRAIAVARRGRPQAITLGRVNGRIFLEACALGLFGQAIVLGEAAKDRHFGDLVRHVTGVLQADVFSYELHGDIRGSGSTMSLVFSNTASIGGNLRISASNPLDPYLELSIGAGRTRTDIVGRAVASALGDQAARPDQVFRFKRLRVTTSPRVRVYADNRPAGRTPATITAEVSALRVLMPPRQRRSRRAPGRLRG